MVKDYKQELQWWNILVTIVHSSSFIALSLISFIRLATTDETRYVNIWLTSVVDPGPSGYIGSFPIFATLIPFPFITAIFHILAALGVDKYYPNVLKRGINRLRWIEYSITNGLMSWSLVFIAGNGGNLFIAISAVISNFFMQYCGYIHEKSPDRNIWLLLLGFIPWTLNWTFVLLLYFYRLFGTGVVLSDSFGILGSFVWSLLFVAPLLYRKYTRNKSVLRANYNTELAYILLSLSAKIWLDWSITIGNLVGN